MKRKEGKEEKEGEEEKEETVLLPCNLVRPVVKYGKLW